MLFNIDGTEVDLIDDGDRQVSHINDCTGYEHDSLWAWARMVKPGRVAVDVGAYTGLFSIIAAKRGARVVAMEPMPANFERLLDNVDKNGVFIEAFEIAASDTNSVASLSYNPRVTLTTGASLEAATPLHREYIEVQCMALDSMELRDVAAMKIDVERHEPAVLRGAMLTIMRDRPTLLIETLDADIRQQVMLLLPSYRIAAVLDTRNTMFVPT